MSFVSWILSGKRVKLRFKHNKGLYGLCRADTSGKIIIDLEPELQNDSRKLLEIFLHETAHAKFEEFLPMELEVSDKIPVERNSYYEEMETRAERQAEIWLKYAEENRLKNLSYFPGCLVSLLEL